MRGVRGRAGPLGSIVRSLTLHFLQEAVSTARTRDLLVTWQQLYQLRQGSPPSSEESAHKIPGTHRLQDNLSDLHAQIAANQRGISLIKELIEQYGLETIQSYMIHVQANAEGAVREMLKSVAAKVSESAKIEGDSLIIEEEDSMDDGSMICSQGCMNNLTFGDDTFGYHETIGGGSGAGPTWDGTSGVQCHVTNTRMTDPEIFEQRYPVLFHRFGLGEKSGGGGVHRGGDGIVREIEFRCPVAASILSERRVHAPRGLEGGEVLRILTPGGGGWGSS